MAGNHRFRGIQLGGSTLLPLIFATVGHLGIDDASAAMFVSRLSTFTYGAVLLGPVMIGLSAHIIGLAWALVALLPLLAWVAASNRLPDGGSVLSDR